MTRKRLLLPALRRKGDPEPLPIAAYLFILAFITLAPAFVFSAILLQRNNDAQLQVVKALTMATSQAIAKAIDGQIESMTTTLRILATSPSLAGSDYASLYDSSAVALSNSGFYLVVMDADGQQLLNTRVPFSTALPRSNAPEVVREALSGGGPIVSNAFIGSLTNRWVILVAMRYDRPDGAHEIIALSKEAPTFVSALQSHQLPDGWSVALIDGRNTVLAASNGAALPSGSQFMNADTGSFGDTGAWNEERVGRDEYISVSARPKAANWQVVAWAPREVVERPLTDAVLSLVLGGLLLAALIVALVVWISQQINLSVRGLADDAKRFGAGQDVPARNYPVAEIAQVSDAIGDAARQRRKAESEVRFLMRELAHRSKNQMTVIAAMAKQTARNATSVSQFVASFERGIMGLARSTDLLLASGMVGVDIKDIVVGQLEPFRPQDPARVTIEGPPVLVNTQASQIVGMAVHELATNAVKYGAFADDAGTLSVTWTSDAEAVDLVWREKVKPKRRRSERTGFGTTVLNSMVGGSLGAKVTRSLHRDGMEWRFVIPLESLNPTRPQGDPASAERGARPDREPAGKVPAGGGAGPRT